MIVTWPPATLKRLFSPVYTSPDKLLNGKNVHGSAFRLHRTRGTTQIFERQTVLQSVTEFEQFLVAQVKNSVLFSKMYVLQRSWFVRPKRWDCRTCVPFNSLTKYRNGEWSKIGLWNLQNWKLHVLTCSSSIPVASCWYSLFPQEKASPSTEICIHNYGNINSYLGVPHTSLVLKETFFSYLSSLRLLSICVLSITEWGWVWYELSRGLLSTSAFSLGDNKLPDMQISNTPISITFLSFSQKISKFLTFLPSRRLSSKQLLFYQNMKGWFFLFLYSICLKSRWNPSNNIFCEFIASTLLILVSNSVTYTIYSI